jgi:hypothetical protein
MWEPQNTMGLHGLLRGELHIYHCEYGNSADIKISVTEVELLITRSLFEHE